MFISRVALNGTITSFVAHLSSRQWDQLPTYFAEDAQWFTNGNPDLVKQAGTQPALEHLKLIPTIADQFDTYSFTINTIVRDGINAIVLATATGDLPNIHYVNNITMAFEVNDAGKFESVREYPDFKQIDWLLEKLGGTS
jgi:ketosteroid isomerase-like protein